MSGADRIPTRRSTALISLPFRSSLSWLFKTALSRSTSLASVTTYLANVSDLMITSARPVPVALVVAHGRRRR
jgi:hypothetical protein